MRKFCCPIHPKDEKSQIGEHEHLPTWHHPEQDNILRRKAGSTQAAVGGDTKAEIKLRKRSGLLAKTSRHRGLIGESLPPTAMLGSTLDGNIGTQNALADSQRKG